MTQVTYFRLKLLLKTLSPPGARLVRVLSLAINISPNNGRLRRRRAIAGTTRSAGAAASLAAEVAAWRMRDFGGSGSALGSKASVWRHWRKRNVGAVSVALVEAAAAAAAARRRRGREQMCSVLATSYSKVMAAGWRGHSRGGEG